MQRCQVFRRFNLNCKFDDEKWRIESAMSAQVDSLTTDYARGETVSSGRNHVDARNLLFWTGLIWTVFWLSFFGWKSNIAPLDGLLAATIILVFLYLLPFLMVISLVFTQRGNSGDSTPEDSEERHPNTVSQAMKLAAAGLISFIYVTLSGAILASLCLFNQLSLIIVLIAVPGIVCGLRLQVMISLLRRASVFISTNNLKPLIAFSVILSLMVRFPFFLEGETGVDSFLYHMLTLRLISTGGLEWFLSPLSLFGLYPAAVVPSPIIYAAGASLLSGLDVEIVLIVSSVIVGTLSTIAFLALAWYSVRIHLIPKEALPLSVALYAFMPLLLKFTDWTMTGRQIFFMIAPFAVLLILSESFGYPAPRHHRILRWSLLTLSLLLSHGMGRILLVYGVVLLLWVEFLPRADRILNSRNRPVVLAGKVKEYLIGHINTRRWNIVLFCLVMLVIPYVLFAIGISGFVGSWVLSRSILTNALAFNPLNAAIGFVFVFTARLGIVSPLFFFGVLLLPLWIKNQPQMRTLLLALTTFFPFFVNSMYFYQSLSITIILFSSCFAVYVIRLLARVLSEIGLLRSSEESSRRLTAIRKIPSITILLRHPSNASSQRRIRSRQTWRMMLVICLLVGSIFSGIFVQNYRYQYEDADVSQDLRLAASFLSTASSFPTQEFEVSEWAGMLLEANDSLTVDDSTMRFQAFHSANDSDSDWVYSNASSVAGWNLVVELRCRVSSNASFIGPYLKVAGKDGLQGNYQEWAITGAGNWRLFLFKVVDTRSIESVGFGFITTNERSGPATLEVEYLRIRSRPVTAIASNQALAQRLGALQNSMPVFPMSIVLYISLYPTLANINVTVSLQFLSFQSLMQVLRNGPFKAEVNYLNEFNIVCKSGMIEDLLDYNDLFFTEFLCHNRANQWRLLDNLKESGSVQLVSNWGGYDVYRLVVT